MGLRATSIKKYEIEYGDYSGFNYDPDTLINIIGEYCNNFYFGGDEISTDAIWEIDREQFADMIEKIDALSEEESNDKMENDWYHGYDTPKEDGYTKEYVLRKFRGYLSDTPENSCYVYIGWL